MIFSKLGDIALALARAEFWKRRGIGDQPRHCRECGIETERPTHCHWCEKELGGGA